MSRANSPLELLLRLLCFVLIFLFATPDSDDKFLESEYGVKYATKCEACKIVADELALSLQNSGRTHDVVETGYHMDKKKKAVKYRVSELRLIETLEGVCETMLSYSIHKERTDVTRFAKGMSQTFQTLHGLVDKGVKVDLGMPYELWDKPNAEVTDLKTKCDTLIEDYEDIITDWYFHLQESVPLHSHLCAKHVLSREDASCLPAPVKGDPGPAERREEL